MRVQPPASEVLAARPVGCAPSSSGVLRGVPPHFSVSGRRLYNLLSFGHVFQTGTSSIGLCESTRPLCRPPPRYWKGSLWPTVFVRAGPLARTPRGQAPPILPYGLAQRSEAWAPGCCSLQYLLPLPVGEYRCATCCCRACLQLGYAARRACVPIFSKVVVKARAESEPGALAVTP